jgi:PAS domain S-box-containing protein
MESMTNRTPTAMHETILFRGVILIVIPLAFEVAFGATLAVLQQQYEHAVNSAVRTKSFNYRINELSNHCTSLLSHGIRYSIKGLADDRQRLIGLNKNLQTDYDELKQLVNDKPQLNNLESIARLTRNLRDLVLTLESAPAGGELDPESLLVDKRNIRRMKQLQDLMPTISRKLRQFREPAERKTRHLIQVVETRQAAIKVALAMGLVSSILLAAGLLMFFMGRINASVRTMLLNTERLRTLQPLLPVLPDIDELGHLDHSFHVMAGAIEHSIRRERAVIDNAADTICALDRQSRFQSINPAGEAMFGRSKSELLQMSLEFLSVESDKERLRTLLDSIAEDGSGRSFECRVSGHDSDIVCILWSVKWSAAEQQFFCIGRNITERKRLEELRQKFIAMISHEIRAPLTSIQGYLTLVSINALGPVPENIRTRALRAEASAGKIIGLINDLLELERVKAGKVEERRRMIYAEDVIEKAAHSVAPLAVELSKSIQSAETNAEMFANNESISRALVCLLSYVLRKSSSDAIRIETVESSNGVEIKVITNDQQIDTLSESTVFEPYGRDGPVDDAWLDLCICNEILRQHGGSLIVESGSKDLTVISFFVPNLSPS